MWSEDAVIRVEGVSKRYVVGRKARTPLGQIRGEVGAGDAVQAVHNVSLEVARGERVAIIGSNGAGKSTLLRMVCGITQPDSGRIWTDGEIVPVIGLQAGFKKDLTGRRNIDIKARLHGMSPAEIERRRDEIAAFADIGRFIDEPMTMYSKGMQARLAFAVAFSMNPEILVVDETLSGGDEAFKRKTMQRLQEIRESGTTILLVSHGPGMIRQLCDRVLLMDQGEKLLEGDPKTVMDAYQQLSLSSGTERDRIRADMLAAAEEAFAATADHVSSVNGERAVSADVADRNGTPRVPEVSPRASVVNGAVIDRVQLLGPDGSPVDALDPGVDATVAVNGRLNAPVSDLHLRVTIRTSNGLAIARLEGGQSGQHTFNGQRPLRARLGLRNRLVPGTYFMDVVLSGRVQDHTIKLHGLDDAMAFVVTGEPESEAEAHVDLTGDADLGTGEQPAAETPRRSTGDVLGQEPVR